MSAPGFCEQIQYLLNAESISTAMDGDSHAVSITDQLIKGVIYNFTENGGMISERAIPASLCERIRTIVKNDDFEVCFAATLGFPEREVIGTLIISRKLYSHSAGNSEQTSDS